MMARMEAEGSAQRNVEVHSPILVQDDTQKALLGNVTNAVKNSSLVD